MLKEEILKKAEIKNLNIESNWNDIKRTIDYAIKNNCKSVCIPPCFIPWANNYINGRISLSTIVSYPNGFNTLETKIFEAKNAIENGICEMGLILNLAQIKDNFNSKLIEEEISEFVKVCNSHIIKIKSKILIDADILTAQEKLSICNLAALLDASCIEIDVKSDKYKTALNNIQMLKNNIDFINEGSNKEKLELLVTCDSNNLNIINSYFDFGADAIGLRREI